MSNLYHFGQFALDPSRRTAVLAPDSSISLTPKAFDVLLFLVQNPNRLVTKEELLQAVWGDTFVEEGNLTQYISHLRKALDHNSEDTRLDRHHCSKGIPVHRACDSVAEAARYHKTCHALRAASDRNLRKPMRGRADFQPQKKLSIHARLVSACANGSRRPRCWPLSLRPSGCTGVNCRRVTLSATDTIVLADVKNETGDPVFDDALDTALRYEMEQTPYLNILGIDKVSRHPGATQPPADYKVDARRGTPDLRQDQQQDGDLPIDRRCRQWLPFADAGARLRVGSNLGQRAGGHR